MNLTIIIPTKNRYPILLLTLEYLQESGFSGEIIVADSTNEQINLKEIIKYKKIRQINCSGLNIEESFYKSALEVKTKYISYSGDDDFLINSGIKKCISFLENNQDFAGCTAVGGYQIINRMKLLYNQIIPYKTSSYEENELSNRLEQMVNNYTAPWFVYRSKNLIETLKICSSFKSARSREIFLLFDTLCDGKIKKLNNCIYVIRGIHNGHYPYPKNNSELIETKVYDAIYTKLKSKKIANNTNEEITLEITKFHCNRNSHFISNKKEVLKFYIQLIWLNLLIIYWRELKIIRKYHKKYYAELS